MSCRITRAPWYDLWGSVRALRMHRGPMAPVVMLLRTVVPTLTALVLCLAIFMPGGLAAIPLLFQVLVLVWIVSACLAGLAGLRTTLRSVRAIWRLGLRGCLRPRPWFELAYVGMILCWAASMVAAGLARYVPDAEVPRPWFDPVTRGLWVLSSVSFWGFIAGALIGYFAALIHWRRPAGRAFRAVHLYLTAVGGVVLFLIGVPDSSARHPWHQEALNGVCLVAGTALVSLAALHAVRLHRRGEFFGGPCASQQTVGSAQ